MTYEGKPSTANRTYLWDGTKFLDGYIGNININQSNPLTGNSVNPNFGTQAIVGGSCGINNGTTTPIITSGSGVPSSTPSQGSVYLRIDGTSNTGFYTYQGGSWSAVSSTAIGTAGGDLTGTYPNPTVVSITGNAGQVAVNASILQKSFILNDGYQGPLVLTNNSATTIYTFAVSASSVSRIVATVMGWDSVDGYSYSADFTTVISRTGSAAPVFTGGTPSPLNVIESSGAVSWTGASMSISGNNLILQVGGGTGVTTHWSCSFNAITVT